MSFPFASFLGREGYVHVPRDPGSLPSVLPPAVMTGATNGDIVISDSPEMNSALPLPHDDQAPVLQLLLSLTAGGTKTTAGGSSAVVGYVAILTAALFFGTSFIPAKRYDTGDGLFYQWIMCSGIFLVAIVLQMILGFPTVPGNTYYYCMFGGALWCTGNVMAVPIIRKIGMGLGLCIWGCSNMLVGWASGFFGILGAKKNPVVKPWMNVAGAFLALLACLLYMFIKPSSSSSEVDVLRQKLTDDVDLDEFGPRHAGPGGSGPAHNEGGGRGGGGGSGTGTAPPSTSSLTSLTRQNSAARRERKKRDKLVGTAMALAAGVFYGANFNPVFYAQGKYPDAPAQILDYVFWHFLGIYLTSTFYFILYCMVTKNRPRYVSPQVIFPALVSGLMWATADVSWFIANASLGMVVAFPLVTSLPGLVASLCGIFLFGEIQGKRNFQFLGAAFGLLVTAGILISASQ